MIPILAFEFNEEVVVAVCITENNCKTSEMLLPVTAQINQR